MKLLKVLLICVSFYSVTQCMEESMYQFRRFHAFGKSHGFVVYAPIDDHLVGGFVALPQNNNDTYNNSEQVCSIVAQIAVNNNRASENSAIAHSVK